MFKWNPTSDTYDEANPSMLLKKISNQFGIAPDIIQRELTERTKVIQWMIDREITDYRDVARIIKIYYTKPEDLLSAI